MGDKVLLQIHLRRILAVAKQHGVSIPSIPHYEQVDVGTLNAYINALDCGVTSDPMTEPIMGFHAYTNGRVIVRLDKYSKPPLPYGVDSYIADNGDLLNKFFHAVQEDAAVVLHYANTGFSYWKEKYTRLGPLSLIHDSEPRAHVVSSRVVLTSEQRLQEQFFRTFFLQNNHNEVAFLAEHGLVQRVHGVAGLLRIWDGEEEEPEVLPGQTIL